MADKYIRVSEKLHRLIKIKSAERHVAMTNFVEICLWKRLKDLEKGDRHNKI